MGGLMGAVSIRQMTDRVSDLMAQKYRVKGELAVQAKKAQRRLPTAMRDALAVLVSATYLAQNPRLMPQIDMEDVAAAYDVAVKHLTGIDAKDRRKGAAVSIGSSIAFSLLVVTVGLVVVLRWRGFI
jgi:hypothetical protein